MAEIRIKHKRSDIPDSSPNVDELQDGEIAINTSDGKLFIKITDDAGTSEVIEASGELKKIRENSVTGYGLSYRQRNPLNYGAIGENAVDLSISTSESTEFGSTGKFSFAAGYKTISSGLASVALGQTTNASNNFSYAEGVATTSSGVASHAEGINTNAAGDISHAEGYMTTAAGFGSHAEGYFAYATGQYSHASGKYTNAPNDSMFVCGQMNSSNPNAIFQVGIGEEVESDTGGSEIVYKTGFEVYYSGEVNAPELTNDLIDNGADNILVTKLWVNSRYITDLQDVDTITNAPQVGDLLEWDGTNWVPIKKYNAGPSSDLPTDPVVGEMYFDTDKNKPVWYNGIAWVDATGADAYAA